MPFGRMSSRTGSDTPINSINVTPLVDVMLVLVVIFILAAPMLARDLLRPAHLLGHRAPRGEFIDLFLPAHGREAN